MKRWRMLTRILLRSLLLRPARTFTALAAVSVAAAVITTMLTLYVDVQALRLRLGPAKRTAIDVTAIFWHFLDGLWLYLMVLFYVWG